MRVLQHSKLSAACTGRLAVLFLFLLPVKNVMAETPTPLQDSTGHTMTVAKVYAAKYSEPGSTRVIFYESARFYKLLKTHPQYKEYISLLKEAQKKRKPVQVWFAGAKGDEIERVERGKKTNSGA